MMDNGKQTTAMAGMMFLTGAVVGTVVGLLVAPHSGAYTRRQLWNWAEDVGDRALDLAENAKQTMSNAKETVSDVVERGKSLVA